MQILITGGAGFIGSHLADELLTRGHRVRALDNLVAAGPRSSGSRARVPRSRGRADRAATCATRDAVRARARRRRRGLPLRGGGRRRPEHVRDRATTPRVNNLGTAVLLEALIERRRCERLVVASSMSIYGEGLYRDADGTIVEPRRAHARAAASRAMGSARRRRRRAGAAADARRSKRRRWRRSTRSRSSTRSACA